MREYTFEYTRQRFAYFLFGVSFAIIGVGLFVFAIFLKDFTSPGVKTIALIILSVTFFLVNKHRIKKTGSAKLGESEVMIELDLITRISFSELKYYYIYDGKNGIVFTLGLNDGTKFKIGANNNFCNVDSLKVFLADFQLTMENYRSENNAKIIHLETIFARKKTVYILSILTILVIVGFCFLRMPIMILPIAVSPSLLVGWIRYFQQKKNSLVDF